MDSPASTHRMIAMDVEQGNRRERTISAVARALEQHCPADQAGQRLGPDLAAGSAVTEHAHKELA